MSPAPVDGGVPAAVAGVLARALVTCARAAGTRFQRLGEAGFAARLQRP